MKTKFVFYAIAVTCIATVTSWSKMIDTVRGPGGGSSWSSSGSSTSSGGYHGGWSGGGGHK